MEQRLSLLERHPHYAEAFEIAEKLRSQGFEALLAGGCVRDAHLGLMPKDLDVATSAQPDDIEKLFERTLPVGKAFGTMIVVLNGHSYEVTTFRQDLPYEDGRHPTGVVFTNAEEDAKRRDFTINALFYNPFRHKTLDYVRGIEDLHARVIRTVGEPKDRFREDHLRLLRAVRFSSQLGFDIEIKTWNAITEHADQIALVSRERVFQELMKLLRGHFPVLGLERLVRSGLAKDVWPSLARLRAEKEAWGEFTKRAKWLQSPEAYFAMFAFFIENRDAFHAELGRLKPPRHLIPSVKRLVQVHEKLWQQKTKKSERVRFWASPEWRWLMEMSAAEAACVPQGPVKLDQWISEYLSVCDAKGDLQKPFLSGEDLLRMGFSPGPLLGKMLEDLYALQLEGQIVTPRQAREAAQNRLEQTSSGV